MQGMNILDHIPEKQSVASSSSSLIVVYGVIEKGKPRHTYFRKRTSISLRKQEPKPPETTMKLHMPTATTWTYSIIDTSPKELIYPIALICGSLLQMVLWVVT